MMFGVCGVAGAVATRKDRFVKRFVLNEICAICSQVCYFIHMLCYRFR